MERPEVSPRYRRESLAIAVWLVLTLAYAATLVLASDLGFVRNLERTGGGSVTGWDKLLHASAFFVLGFLLMELMSAAWPVAWRPRIALAACVVGGLYAAFHEGVQAFLPGFTFNPYDFLADVIGAGAGILSVAAWRSVAAMVTGTAAARR